MLLEELLGLSNVLVGLFVLVFCVAYFSTRSDRLATATRGMMLLVLSGMVLSSLVSGFSVLGGALSGFAENPILFIIPASIVMLGKVTTVVASIIGTVRIINARRKRVG